MADEKQDLTLSFKESNFRLLPNEIFLVLSSYFSLPELGKLRGINKFFINLVKEIIFFSERTKFFLAEVFFTLSNEKLLTKRFFRNEVHHAPKKVDFSGAEVVYIDSIAFPKKNFILKDSVFVKGINFYQTTLLNKVALKIFTKIKNRKILTIDNLNNYVFDCDIYCKNGILINIEAFDFVEHSIFHRFGVFPTEAQAKAALKCHFSVISGNEQKLLLVGVGCEDKVALQKIKDNLNALHSLLKEKCFTFVEKQYHELTDEYGEDGNFTIMLPISIALLLFLTNPIHIALHLLNTPKYFAEDDFQESCEILLTEIEKFRGFCRGVPDEGLDKLKSRLESAIVWKRRLTQKQTEESANDLQDSYSHITGILNSMQGEIISEPDAVNRSYLQSSCKEMQTQAAIRTVEQGFKTNFDNKADCQKKFKEVINSPYLNIVQRAKLFTQFKDRDELNRHRNPRLDSFFGIKNTTSWRETWKEIRDEAKQKLFSEVEALPAGTQKQTLLNWARTQSLFCDHRNNTVFKGAFGRTQAVSDIDTKLESLELF